MLFKYLIGAVVLANVPIAPPARAEFINGNQLYEWCSAEERDANYYQKNASCRAYVIGALDDFLLEMEIAKKPECIPSNATRGQMADVVTKLLRDEPTIRNLSGPLIVRMAVVKGFGCSLKRD